MLKVLIADDEPRFMEAVKRILESDGELNVIGIANNGQRAFELCKDNKPDIVLMDIRMPGMDGIEATKLIKQYDSNIKVLILTTFCEDKYISKAVGNKCDGYILKDIDDLDKFISTIKNTCKGLRILDREVFNKLVFDINDVQRSEIISQELTVEGYGLSGKEIEVIKYITAGKKNSEIASEIYTTEGVVKNIITKVLEKLNLRNCKELAVWGARRGL